MRPLVAAAAAALLLTAGACSGGATSSGSAAGCGKIDPPPGSLMILPAGGAARSDAALCRVVQHAVNVVVSDNDPAVAKRLAGMAPGARVWQVRQLQYAPRVCPTCADTVVKLDDIRAQHPEWILQDASGAPVQNGDGTLLDFGDPGYQAEWVQKMADSLAAAPWTGVVVDADNTEPWASPPIDPRTDQPMTDDDRADYLAQALALVRGALKTQGWSLVAHNPPITDPDEGQIASTDAVLTTTGFSGKDAAAWTALYRYLEVAVKRDVGVWITDRPGPAPSERLFGFASYLLVADGPYSAYSPTTLDDPLYRVSLGKPTDDPQESDGAYTRMYEQGAVGVNPGASPVSVDLGTFGTFVLQPGRAVVATSDHTYR